jgi:predicted aconitase with swiveling domain
MALLSRGGVRGGGAQPETIEKSRDDSPSESAEILVPGNSGAGKSLILTAPISFWGGVDPKSGRIADVRHPQCGECIAGRVLFLPGTIGSSSASAVLLELVRNGHAPAALVLHEPDAILLLGLIVAREMGWETPMAVRMDRSRFPAYAGKMLRLGEDGTLTIAVERFGEGAALTPAAAARGPAGGGRRRRRGC